MAKIERRESAVFVVKGNVSIYLLATSNCLFGPASERACIVLACTFIFWTEV